MTPQERAAVEKIAAEIMQIIKTMAFPEPAIVRLIGQAVMRSKQNGLLLALGDLDYMYWKDHKYANQLRERISNRLAQEG